MRLEDIKIPRDKWQSFNSQCDKILSKYNPQDRAKLNNIIVKKINTIATHQSLGLIYDKYGNQVYKKTPNVQNFLSCKNSGFASRVLLRDDSKLIPVNKKNNFDTGFMEYDSFKGLNERNLPATDHTLGFEEYNDNNLYITKAQHELPNDAVNAGIDEAKLRFNTDWNKEFEKIDKTFIGQIK